MSLRNVGNDHDETKSTETAWYQSAGVPTPNYTMTFMSHIRPRTTPFYLQIKTTGLQIKTTGVQIKTTGVQIKTQDFKLQRTVFKRNYGGQIETQDLEFKATGFQFWPNNFHLNCQYVYAHENISDSVLIWTPVVLIWTPVVLIWR